MSEFKHVPQELACKKKILFIDNYGHLGGGQIIGADVFRVLQDGNYTVDACVPHPSDFSSILNKISPISKIYPLTTLSIRSGRKNIADILKAGLYVLNNIIIFYRIAKDYDLLYLNNARLSLIIAFLSILLRKKFIIHLHLMHDDFALALLRLVAKRKQCLGLVCCSEYISKQWDGSGLEFKVNIVTNALRPDYVNRPFQSRFKNGIVAAFIGDITYDKGADIYLSIAKKFPAIKFYLIGRRLDNKLPPITPVCCASLANVIINPPVSDIATFIEQQGINLVIVPSRVQESFGMTALEACSLSCLTLVSASGNLGNLGHDCACIVCYSEEEFILKITQLSATPVDDLVLISRESWRLANEKYGFNKFRESLLQSIKMT